VKYFGTPLTSLRLWRSAPRTTSRGPVDQPRSRRSDAAKETVRKIVCLVTACPSIAPHTLFLLGFTDRSAIDAPRLSIRGAGWDDRTELVRETTRMEAIPS